MTTMINEVNAIRALWDWISKMPCHASFDNESWYDKAYDATDDILSKSTILTQIVEDLQESDAHQLFSTASVEEWEQLIRRLDVDYSDSLFWDRVEAQLNFDAVFTSTCEDCGGSGLQTDINGEPDDCTTCKGELTVSVKGTNDV